MINRLVSLKTDSNTEFSNRGNGKWNTDNKKIQGVDPPRTLIYSYLL